MDQKLQWRNFNNFIASNVISKFGDSVDVIGLMWLTQEITHSAWLTGLVLALNGLPALVLGLFTGIIADRFQKKQLMLFCDFFRGLTVLAIMTMYWTKLLNVEFLILATLINSTLEILSSPSRRSMPPLLLEKEDLIKGNAHLSTGKMLAQIIGLSAAGIIIQVAGVSVVLGIDAATFLISFALIRQISVDSQPIQTKFNFRNVCSEVKESFHILTGQSVIFKTTILATAVNLFIGPFNLLLLHYCKKLFNGSSSAYSMLNAFYLLGIILSNYFIVRKIKKLGKEQLIHLGFASLAISYFLMGVTGNLGISIAIMIFYGIGTSFITIPSVTLIQMNTPKVHLGKVLSLISLVNECSVPLGYLVFGMIISRVEIQDIFIVSASMMILILGMVHLGFKWMMRKNTFSEKQVSEDY